MPFSIWQCHLDVGELALQHIHAPHDLFFIHWHLKETAVNEDGFLTAIAEHPSAPRSHPHVGVVIDPLTRYLVAYHDGAELFSLLGDLCPRQSPNRHGVSQNNPPSPGGIHILPFVSFLGAGYGRPLVHLHIQQAVGVDRGARRPLKRHDGLKRR